MDHAGLLGNLRHLLPGVATVRRHGHCLAGSGLVSIIFANIPATVRSRVGCVGENSRSSCDNSATGSGRHADGAAAISSGDKSAAAHITAAIAEPTGALAL